MKVLHSLNDLRPSPRPVVLTLGNFDGVHLGHQAILNRLKALSKMLETENVVISFENHPAEVLRSQHPLRLLCPPLHKQKLLEKAQIDSLLLLPFTYEFSQQTAEQFLTKIHTCLPFSHLILGFDAKLGKDRQGDQQTLQSIAKKLQFQVEYLDQIIVNQIPVSSTKIRELVEQGQFCGASELLGRKFSIRSSIIRGLGLGKTLGYPTANLAVDHLCLPPFGIYAVSAFLKNQELKGIASLGTAPTVRQDRRPILEIHLFDYQEDIYNHELEVIFDRWIRPEYQFDSLEALKVQMEIDVLEAKVHY